jgi:hypothetical protein
MPHRNPIGGQEYDLKNRNRQRRRLKWAGKGISDTDALTAYLSFTAHQDDADLELVIGRLLVILDRHDLLEER